MPEQTIDSEHADHRVAVIAETSDSPSQPEATSASEDDPAVELYACGFSIRTIADATGRGVKAVRGVLLGPV